MRLLAVVLATLVLAGCSSPAAPPPAATEPPPALATGPAPAADPAVGEGAAAPTWAVGDHWTWTVESDAPEPLAVTTVVVSAGAEGYVVGVTDEAAGLASQWAHLPPHGVLTATLGWEMHDTVSELLAFPLEDGATWQATLEGAAVLAEATRVELDGRAAYRVVGLYEEGGTAFEGLYDPGIAQWATLSLLYGSDAPWATARVTAHGSGHAGEAYVQRADDLLLAGAGKPGVPTAPQTFEVAEGPTHVVLGCQMGGGPGVREVHFVAPGEAWACRQASAADARTMQVHAPPAVPGTWTVAFGLVGPGWAYTEVTAVTSARVDVASG